MQNMLKNLSGKNQRIWILLKKNKKNGALILLRARHGARGLHPLGGTHLQGDPADQGPDCTGRRPPPAGPGSQVCRGI